MQRFHARCSYCEATTTISTDDLQVETPAAGRVLGRARFRCGTCENVVDVPIDALLTDVLLEDELERHAAAAPPLTYDDLLDLHELLEHDDWFALLEAGLQTPDDREPGPF